MIPSGIEQGVHWTGKQEIIGKVWSMIIHIWKRNGGITTDPWIVGLLKTEEGGQLTGGRGKGIEIEKDQDPEVPLLIEMVSIIFNRNYLKIDVFSTLLNTNWQCLIQL